MDNSGACLELKNSQSQEIADFNLKYRNIHAYNPNWIIELFFILTLLVRQYEIIHFLKNFFYYYLFRVPLVC